MERYCVVCDEKTHKILDYFGEYYRCGVCKCLEPVGDIKKEERVEAAK
jgi:hypothetical protein